MFEAQITPTHCFADSNLTRLYMIIYILGICMPLMGDFQGNRAIKNFKDLVNILILGRAYYIFPILD